MLVNVSLSSVCDFGKNWIGAIFLADRVGEGAYIWRVKGCFDSRRIMTSHCLFSILKSISLIWRGVWTKLLYFLPTPSITFCFISLIHWRPRRWNCKKYVANHIWISMKAGPFLLEYGRPTWIVAITGYFCERILRFVFNSSANGCCTNTARTQMRTVVNKHCVTHTGLFVHNGKKSVSSTVLLIPRCRKNKKSPLISIHVFTCSIKPPHPNYKTPPLPCVLMRRFKFNLSWTQGDAECWCWEMGNISLCSRRKKRMWGVEKPTACQRNIISAHSS